MDVVYGTITFLEAGLVGRMEVVVACANESSGLHLGSSDFHGMPFGNSEYKIPLSIPSRSSPRCSRETFE